MLLAKLQLIWKLQMLMLLKMRTRIVLHRELSTCLLLMQFKIWCKVKMKRDQFLVEGLMKILFVSCLKLSNKKVKLIL